MRIENIESVCIRCVFLSFYPPFPHVACHLFRSSASTDDEGVHSLSRLLRSAIDAYVMLVVGYVIHTLLFRKSLADLTTSRASFSLQALRLTVEAVVP